MTKHPVPKWGQLIPAGGGAALICLPIYAVLTVLAFARTSLGGTSINPPSVLEVLGTMFTAIPFSLIGIVVWPISLIVAAGLFALAGRLLIPRVDDLHPRGWIWAAAGVVVGLVTGISMALEMKWRSSFPFDQQANLGTIYFAVPTGIIGIFIFRSLARRALSRPGRYTSANLD